jgi:deoxyribodipyrimidine photo-lyase
LVNNDRAAPAVVWLRQDLRIADNPALAAAALTGRPVLPVYILDEASPGRWAPRGAGRWWLGRSLAKLGADLAALGAKLVLRRGESGAELETLIAESGARAVYWNRCYEPWAIARDKKVKARLKSRGILAESFNAALLHEPWTMATGTGGPFKVFTPFWRALLAKPSPASAMPAPARIAGLRGQMRSEALEAWGLQPRAPDWSSGLAASWEPGEAGARQRLDQFLEVGAARYAMARDRPDIAGTARLSPYLHWGEIGPRQIWLAVSAARDSGRLSDAAALSFLRQLGWREFTHHQLYHWPDLPEQPWRPAFAAFAWRQDAGLLRAWQRGRTGYPIVDAGMAELWATGWMHNRVRMIAASFLIKHLLQPWQAGEAWFWDTLVDADLAQNAASWQWVAGSGADAAPYFRIFNPVLQGEKFDPEGSYVRRWIPALARMEQRNLHAPWRAGAAELAAAGVRLGTDYPRPIVDHALARAGALAAFAALKARG